MCHCVSEQTVGSLTGVEYKYKINIILPARKWIQNMKKEIMSGSEGGKGEPT